MIRKALAVSVTVALLTACGGSGSVSTNSPAPEPEPPPPPVTVVPDINGAQVIAGSLEQPGASSFERYLKNGIFFQSSGGARLEGAPVTTAVPDSANDGASGGFSQTNTAEVGVDEADRVEYDGDFMYVATQPVWNGHEAPAAGVRVMQRNDDFSLTEINNLQVSAENSNVNGMYLYQDSLSVVSSGYPMMTLVDIASTSLFAPEGGFTNTVDMQIFDTSTPAQANVTGDIAIDGWLVASRRIDNYIYIVSSYSPYVELPFPFAEDEEQRLANYEFLLSVDMADVMPTISINGAVSNLNQAEDCFIPEQATEADGNSQLLTITKINVQQLNDVSSVCLGAYADTSYMSTESMFLAGWSETGTVLHKIDIADSFTYAASGEVAGQIRGDNLRMSESEGFFRIVTTDWSFRSTEGPEHQLFVLQQDGADLRTVAQLPNDEQPAAIGKPNEDIFAVRFIQDKAYIITFERTDPLYVIDLTDNTAPNIAGELEIPGFSSYLHPMENGYLLGVGQEVEQQQIPDTGDVPITFPVQTGVKVSLFDVSDPSNPLELSNVSFDNTYTPVEYDYRALSVLKTGDQYQFAMPLEAWIAVEGGGEPLPGEPLPEPLPETDPDAPGEDEEEGEGSEGEENEEPAPGFTVYQPQNSLLMLTVNAASGAGAMTVTNKMDITEDRETYSWSGEDRSVIHGDNVYFIHGNLVWQSLWMKDAAINGPF